MGARPEEGVMGGLGRHDARNEMELELLKRHDFHYAEGDTLAFPPAPKWRPEHRGKL